MNRKHARIAHHEFQLEPEELASLPGADPAPADNLTDSGKLDDAFEPILTAGLRTLTDTERAVLLLRAVGDLRYREISDSLEIPLGSVMGNLSRARQKMRAFLGRAARRARILEENEL